MKRLLAAALLVALATATSFPGISGGKFEVTCAFVGDNQVDPIVSPGVTPSAHLHAFFGNRGVTATSTAAALVGGATSCKVADDSAGYWVPAAYRTDTGAEVKPQKAFEYYFGTPGAAVEHIPAGLEMVAGDAHATGPPATKTAISFSCGNGATGNHSPVRTYPYNCLTDPNTTNSQGVVAIVAFPYCWDGTGLLPADVVYGDSAGACPAGFDHRLPQLQQHVHYGTGFQRGDLLTFSSGPYYTLHADYLQAWRQARLDTLVDTCLVPHRDCSFLTS